MATELDPDEPPTECVACGAPATHRDFSRTLCPQCLRSEDFRLKWHDTLMAGVVVLAVIGFIVVALDLLAKADGERVRGDSTFLAFIGALIVVGFGIRDVWFDWQTKRTQRKFRSDPTN